MVPFTTTSAVSLLCAVADLDFFPVEGEEAAAAETRDNTESNATSADLLSPTMRVSSEPVKPHMTLIARVVYKKIYNMHGQ
jgi:hypothetical protein